MMRLLLLLAPALAAFMLLAVMALDTDGRQSLLAGIMDPFLGLDHFMVLLGVGLWGGTLGGTARWALPVAFLGGAALGFGLAIRQAPFPFLAVLIQGLVIGSMLLVAGVLFVPIRLPLREAVSATIMFGGSYGYLHWLEIGTETALLWFGMGFLTAAAVLLAAGVGVAAALSPARPN